MNKRPFLTLASVFLLLTTFGIFVNIPKVSSWAFWKYNVGNAVTSVAVSSDGAYTVVGTKNGSLLLLNNQGTPIWSKSLGYEVEGVSISGDGNRILVGVAEYYPGRPDVFLFDKNGNVTWQRDFVQSGRPCDVSISQDGNYIATGDTNRRVRFFNSTGDQLWEKELGGWAASVSVSSTGDYIAAGSWDDNVYFFNKSGGQLWSYNTGDYVDGVSVSPEGGYVASTGTDIFFFDGSGTPLWNLTYYFGEDIAASENGNYIAVAEKYHNKITLLNKTGAELWERDVNRYVNCIALTSDGRFVVGGAEDGFVYFIENLQPTSLTCMVFKPKILLGEEVNVSGSISPPIEGAEVTLTFTRPNNTYLTINTSTTAGGVYNQTYTPDMIGFWRVQASWAGDAQYMGAESPEISFSVGESTITCKVSNWQVYIEESITVSGTIDPPHVGVEVTLAYTDPEGMILNRTATTTDGSNYSDTLAPNLEGMWRVLASWPGDTDTMGAVSSEVKFLVSRVTEVNVKIGRNQTFFTVFEPSEDYYYSPMFESIVWDKNISSPAGINFTTISGTFYYYETIPGLGGTITSFNITYNIGVLDGTSEGTYEVIGYYDISSQSKFWPYPITFLFTYELRCKVNAVTKYETSIYLSIPPQVKLGEATSISGAIVPTGGPPVAGVNVTLSYTKPDGSVVNRTVVTGPHGSFQDVYAPEMPGTWGIKASWAGDEDHNGNESLQVPFNVLTDLMHQVTWGTSSYFIRTLSNSTVSDFFFKGSAMQVSFNVSGLPGTEGFCNVTIPGNLLWGEFTVYLDGSPLTRDINYTQTYNGTHYLFCILYSHSSGPYEIEIFATHIIPEFPSYLILPLFMVAILLVVIVYRRKFNLNQQKRMVGPNKCSLSFRSIMHACGQSNPLLSIVRKKPS